MDDYVDPTPDRAPPPASDTQPAAASEQPPEDFLLGVAARPKGRGAWQLVGQGFDSRAEAERIAGDMRGRFPEQDIRVIVMGFPEEGARALIDGPVAIGLLAEDIIGTLLSLQGLMDDEARRLTRTQLATRRIGRARLGVVRGGS